MKIYNAKSKLEDLHVPIDLTDTSSIIPPDEDIIYSTMCGAEGVWDHGNKSTIRKWASHVLITSNGVAYSKPVKPKKKRNKELMKEYTPWFEVTTVANVGRFGTAIRIAPINLKLQRFTDVESKEEFEERKIYFVEKFRPILIRKKEEWLEENEDNPDIKKWKKKSIRKSLERMKKRVRDIFIKSIKKEILKPAKKLGKVAKKKDLTSIKNNLDKLVDDSKDLIVKIKKKLIEGEELKNEINHLESELKNFNEQIS